MIVDECIRYQLIIMIPVMIDTADLLAFFPFFDRLPLSFHFFSQYDGTSRFHTVLDAAKHASTVLGFLMNRCSYGFVNTS